MSEQARREARARARAYGLLSRLVLVGLDAASRELVDQLPVLAERIGEGASADDLAAEHHALFAMEVFPYESVYLDDSGRPGGERSEAVADFYRRAGFGARFDDVTADHLGAELAFLSFTSAAEADAERDAAGEAAERCRDLTREFLDRHLLTWLAPFAAACIAQPRSFWTTVVEMVVELALSHRRDLGPLVPTPSATTGGATSLLDDPDTDVRRIAEHLCRPHEAGVLFTRQDIQSLGRRLSLPTGFGSRAQRMQCLIESAAQYDNLPGLVEAIDAAIAARVDALWSLSPLGEAWLARAESTQELLRRLADVALHASRPDKETA